MWLQSAYHKKLDQQYHSTRIIALANEIQLQCVDVLMCGFAQKITHTPTDRAPVAYQKMVKAFNELCALIENENDSAQKSRRAKLVREIKLLCDRIMSKSTKLSSSQADEGFGGLVGDLNTFNTIRMMVERMGDDINELVEPYRNLKAISEGEAKEANKAIEVFGLISLVFAVLPLGLCGWFVWEFSKSIRVLMENTKRLANSQPLLAARDTGDEMAVLDTSFRNMADALAAANRRTRATIDNAGDIICVLNSTGKIVEVNPAASELLGYASDELKGSTIEKIVRPQDLSRARTQLASAIENSGKSDFDCHLTTAEGGSLYSEWTVQWAPSEQELFCVVHDLTERKQIEKMKQEFFDMVSHDMRTPLSSVALGIQAVTKSKTYTLPESAAGLLKKAEENAVLLIRLVNDLLDMDKIESGKIELRYARFSIKRACDKAITIVSALAERKKLAIAGPTDDILVVGDPDRILRVIINLLANAIKFSPKKTSIEVRFAATPDYIEVSIQDQGRGIPPEMCDHVFDRFTQVEIGDATKKGGSGLGLAICKSFVELHNGSIGVESELEKGSRFWFRLPLSNRTDVPTEDEETKDDDDDDD